MQKQFQIWIEEKFELQSNNIFLKWNICSVGFLRKINKYSFITYFVVHNLKNKDGKQDPLKQNHVYVFISPSFGCR